MARMTYLLDTDTLIFLVRGSRIQAPRNQRQETLMKMAQRVLNRCRRHQDADDDVGLSAITVAELEYGARHSDDYDNEIVAVRKILAPFSLFDFTADTCALHYGEVRRELEISGGVIGAMDMLIAAHARALGAMLITGNSKHFAHVPGLRSENWTA